MSAHGLENGRRSEKGTEWLLLYTVAKVAEAEETLDEFACVEGINLPSERGSLAFGYFPEGGREEEGA